MRWLEADRLPRLVLDADGRIVWTNTAAVHSLRAPLPIMIEASALRFAGAAQAKLAGRFFAQLGGDVRRLSLMPDDGGDGGLVISAWAEGDGAARRTFIKVTPLQPLVGAEESGMAAHFQLTRAECAVVDGLLRTDSPAEIARDQRVSVHTVRSHIRNIYAKTGVHTQAQFVRLCLIFTGG